MPYKIFIGRMTAIVSFLMFASFSDIGFASEPDITNDSITTSPQAFLRLRSDTFDPLQRNPQNSELLSLTSGLEAAVDTSSEQTYIVQLRTKALPSLQSKIKALGGDIYSPIPDQALLVQLTATEKAALEQTEFVRWIGAYRADHKLDPSLQALLTTKGRSLSTIGRYRLLLLDGNDIQKKSVQALVSKLGGNIFNVSSSRLIEVEISLNALLSLALHKDIEYIDLWSAPESDMDIVREYGGANYLEGVTSPGYTGQGVRAEVMDGGLYVSHNDFQANRPILHGRIVRCNSTVRQ